MKLSVKNLQNWIFGKNDHFFTLFGQKIPNFDISHVYHYSHTLVLTWEKTLGSFQPKLITKIEVISRNLQKTGFLAKNDHFLTLFGQKNPQFWIFPQIPLLAHASRHTGEDFRKFSAKTNDKNLSYKSKTLKKTGFLSKIAIFWYFLAEKIPNFEFSRGYHYSNTLVDT